MALPFGLDWRKGKYSCFLVGTLDGLPPPPFSFSLSRKISHYDNLLCFMSQLTAHHHHSHPVLPPLSI